MTRQSLTPLEDAISMTRPIEWGKINDIIMTEIDAYLDMRRNDTSSNGINRARNIQQLLEKHAVDHTFYFALLCAIFSIENPSKNRFVNFFKSMTTSGSKRLASMIAEKLISGRYSETRSYRNKIASFDTLSSDSFDEELLQASKNKCMGTGYGSEMESKSDYDKYKGVRFILSEILMKTPDDERKNIITMINALKINLIKPIESKSTPTDTVTLIKN